MKKNKHILGKNIRKKLGFLVNEHLNFTDMSAKIVLFSLMPSLSSVLDENNFSIIFAIQGYKIS